MTEIRLLNGKQYMSDIHTFTQTAKIQSGSLFFVIRYNQISNYLVCTNLIADLCDIIMTYVNDEVEMKYQIVNNLPTTDNMTIYYTLECSIWLEKYEFKYADYVKNYRKSLTCQVYLSVYNNMFSLDGQLSDMGFDIENGMYRYHSTVFLSAFMKHVDKSYSGVYDKYYPQGYHIEDLKPNKCKISCKYNEALSHYNTNYNIYDLAKLTTVIRMMELVHLENKFI